jgi:hypothetical protein
MRVTAFEPHRWTLWADTNPLTTWAWSLDPTPDGRTRLITRVRSRPSWRHPSTVAWLLLFEVADFPLMRKCLLGIKHRAETSPPMPGSPGALTDHGRGEHSRGAGARCRAQYWSVVPAPEGATAVSEGARGMAASSGRRSSPASICGPTGYGSTSLRAEA